MPNPAPWGVYLRISRTDDRLGVERQLEDCQFQLEEMRDTDPDRVELYDENNTSATKGLEHRPEYRRMMADAEAGRITGVMVYLQDRAWRDTDELSAFLKLAETRGIRFATSSTGEANLDDPHTIANLKTNAVNAELEIKLASRRVRRATKQRAGKGKPHGRAPFGWRREVSISSGRVVDSWDELEDAEAGVIRHAADELLRGKSLRSIAFELNAGDVKPRPMVYRKGRYKGRESARVWNTDQLRVLLLRESNAGLRIHKGEVVGDATWPAILDRQKYTRLRTLLADPARRTTDKGSAPRWLLSGIATCSVCPDGGRINVITGGARGRRPAYTCTGQHGSKGCMQRHWTDDLDQYVGDLVEARLADPAYGKAAPEAQTAIDGLYAQIDAHRAEQATYPGLKRAGRITLGQLLELNADADAAIADLDAQIKALRAQLSIGVELPDGWAGADLLTKRALIRDLFERLALVPSTVNGRYRTIATVAEEVEHRFR